jgi:hypothetical protein
VKREDAQPALAGVVASLVGFAGSFAVVLAGLRAVGADRVQASSGLLVLSVSMGLTGIVLCWRMRMPVSIAWSTPGAWPSPEHWWPPASHSGLTVVSGAGLSPRQRPPCPPPSPILTCAR